MSAVIYDISKIEAAIAKWLQQAKDLRASAQRCREIEDPNAEFYEIDASRLEFCAEEISKTLKVV